MTQAIRIADGVHWVGAVDWNLRDYHGYTLPGTTYNAYLVVGEKVALIDSTYKGFEGEQLDRVASGIDPKRIDCIVLNHIEPDHSGGLPVLARLLPGVPIYCTAIAQKGLARNYDVSGWNFVTAKTGDTIDLGKGKVLTFLEAPMLSLAGLHVHVPRGRGAPLLERCLRPAHRLVPAVRRRARTR